MRRLIRLVLVLYGLVLGCFLAYGLLCLTALNIAAFNGHLSVVEFLVGAGASVDDGALRSAASGGQLAVVRYLVEEQGADLEATGYDGSTALHDAAWYGRLSVVEYLVGQGADVNARKSNGVTARDEAVSCSTDADRSAERRADCSAVVEYLDSLVSDE